MNQIKNGDERFDELVVRILNKIKRPATAEEITELMNRELGLGDRPFRMEEVESWLQSPNRKVAQLYWLAARPRR